MLLFEFPRIAWEGITDWMRLLRPGLDSHLSEPFVFEVGRKHRNVLSHPHLIPGPIWTHAMSEQAVPDQQIAIAADVGYTDLSLFNRQFARAKGATPSNFRKHHRIMLGSIAD